MDSWLRFTGRSLDDARGDGWLRHQNECQRCVGTKSEGQEAAADDDQLQLRRRRTDWNQQTLDGVSLIDTAPEPSTLALCGAGILALAATRRRWLH